MLTVVQKNNALGRWYKYNDEVPTQFNLQLKIAQDGSEIWECEFDYKGKWTDCTLWCSDEHVQVIAKCQQKNLLDDLINYNLWEKEWDHFEYYDGSNYKVMSVGEIKDSIEHDAIKLSDYFSEEQ